MALSDIEQQQQDQIRKSYAQMRAGLGARQDVARQQLSEDLARSEGQMGGFGGAGLKIRQKALNNLNTGFAAEGTNVGAQEAQQLAGLESEKAARAYGTQERLGSEAFTGEQARLAREQQASQFGQTLGEQKRQFGLEFDENKMTNAVNAMIALKDAKLNNAGDYQKLWGGIWQKTYGQDPRFSNLVAPPPTPPNSMPPVFNARQPTWFPR